MAGKILVLVFALLAGAGGAFGFQLVSEHLELPSQEKEDPRLLELEGQLAALTQKIQELNQSFQTAGSETDILAARLNTLDGKFSKLQEKQGELAMPNNIPSSAENPGSLSAGTETAKTGSPETVTTRQISGQELVTALKDLPDEGKEMIRKAIYNEVQRIKKEQEFKAEPKVELEKKVDTVIKKLTAALSLTPVQTEQMREIGARHIDRMTEAATVARERNDPEYARSAKNQIETQTKSEIIELLTPEQFDKLREIDPDGIGKEYPRGF